MAVILNEKYCENETEHGKNVIKSYFCPVQKQQQNQQQQQQQQQQHNLHLK